jgi:DNA-binding PucR family transcriptional regulator
MSLVAEKDDGVVLLLGRPGAARRRGRRSDGDAQPTSQLDPVAVRLIEDLRGEVARVDPTVSLSAVVASPVAWRDLRRAHGVARRAQVALRLLGERGQIVSTTDPRLAIFLLLDGTETASLREFVNIVLGPLLAYDELHGRVLVDTLAAYLAGEGHLETIARSLRIHASTLKYRLRRIGEVGGLDLRNPDHRFNAAIALRLRAILPPE